MVTRPLSSIRTALLLGTLLALPGCGHLFGGGPGVGEESTFPLERRIENLLAEAPFDGVQWGILVMDARSGRTLFARNAATRFIPASNMKLPVTTTALELLGPDFRWETAFYSEAAPVEGVVEGTLYLAGSGDPSLGAPFYPSSAEALAALVDSLLAAGVRRVAGPLIVDVSAWDSTTVPESWMVGNLSPTFGATGGAFVVGRGEVAIRVSGGANPGDAALVEGTPLGTESFVEGHVVTVASRDSTELRADFLPESRKWVISGSVAVGEMQILAFAARDPVRIATRALARSLEEKEIVVEGGVVIRWEGGGAAGAASTSGPVGDAVRGAEVVVPAGAAIGERAGVSPGREDPSSATASAIADPAPTHRLAGLASPPLSDVVEVVLDTSQNWMTEQIVRTLGARLGVKGSWSEGFRIVEEHLVRDLAIDSLDIHMEDGSGLSAYNLLTPRAIVRILAHAQTRPWGALFRAALPDPGRPGGTLEGRLAGLEGRVSAKTGTIMNVNSLSGYLRTNAGDDLLFSILSNGSNLPASQVRGRMDALVREMANGR